jgi:pyruvate,water dikinase
MDNRLIRGFDDITSKDVRLVGGKGANLGEMTRAGLTVPPGFCLTAAAYREFISGARASATIGAILAQADLENPEDVEIKTAQLRAFLVAQPMPVEIARAVLGGVHALGAKLGTNDLRVAVRSSATAEDLPDASFAGQQDTYLNVRGDDALLEHVKLCWASLWTARAVTYRQKQGYDHSLLALAVVIQAMIESEVAGILFTANPVNQDRDQIVLNASWGLGDAVVSGLVTPDTWIVSKLDGAILDREIASKLVAVVYAPDGGTHQVPVPLERQAIASLSDAQIGVLTDLGRRIEAHYARPMDIEWGHTHDTFYLLQARPITTLVELDAAVARTASNPPIGSAFTMSRGTAESDRGEYNRSMFVEIFPDPLSPAFLSVITPLFRSMLDFTFRKIGFEPPRGIPAVGVYYNQPYFHREYIDGAFSPLSPPVRTAMVSQIVNPFGKHERKLQMEASPAFLGMIARLLRFMIAFPKQLPGLLAEYRKEVHKLATLPLESMSERDIIERVRETIFIHASVLLNYDFLLIALVRITYQMLGTLLDRRYGHDSEQVRAKLISGVTGNVTMETNKKIWDLAQEAKASPTVREILTSASGRQDFDALRQRLQTTGDGRIFLAELDAFLEQYGHREIRMDILYPTWGEDPMPVLQFVRGYFDVGQESSPHRQQERLVAEREELARRVDRELGNDLTGRLAITPIFRWVLTNTQVHTRERDTMHFELTRLFPPLRRALLELGRRWQRRAILDASDDIFFLTLDDILTLAESPQPMQEVVKARRAEFDRNAQHSPPAIVRNGVPVEVAAEARETGTGQLRGIAGSPGLVTGRVRVIHGPQDFDKLQRGEILVAPLTNPVWTPLFAIAGGIVTQVGGILSHGAIVAREYGIPAVMAVKDATAVLRDGENVTVDGNKGVVILGV